LQGETIVDSEMSVHKIIGGAGIDESLDVFDVLSFQVDK